MNLQHLSDTELWNQTKQVSIKEKQACLLLLDHLHEVELRRLYAKRAYSSLFEYVCKELGYSESQATERINAMRLIAKNPEVKSKVETGRLSLTTASQLQRFFKSEKKIRGAELSPQQKSELIVECENQSKRNVEKILLEKSKASFDEDPKETLKRFSATLTELKLYISEACLEKIEEIKNLKGHDVSIAKVFEQSLDLYLEALKKKNYGVAKATLPATWKFQPINKTKERSRYISKPLRRWVHTRAKGQCEYVDSLTSRRCQRGV